jgi:Uncharacterized protein conserved in bacteria
LNSDYYVYIHIRKTDNKVFYVGKGKGERFKSRVGRNRYWKYVESKHGFYSIKIEENISEEKAFELEVLMIELLQDKYKLCNMTKGGEGASGLKHSEESITKMIESKTGNVPSEETKAKISIALKGSKKSESTKIKIKIFRFDKKCYVFLNRNINKMICCTRRDFCEKFDMKHRDIAVLFKKKPIKSVKGWEICDRLNLLQIIT